MLGLIARNWLQLGVDVSGGKGGIVDTPSMTSIHSSIVSSAFFLV